MRVQRRAGDGPQARLGQAPSRAPEPPASGVGIVWCSCRGAASFLAMDGPPEPHVWVRHCGLGRVLPPRSSDLLEL